MSIKDDRAELKLVDTHISDILKTGQSYSSAGSHSLTHVDLGELRSHRAALRRRILTAKGYSGRVS